MPSPRLPLSRRVQSAGRFPYPLATGQAHHALAKSQAGPHCGVALKIWGKPALSWSAFQPQPFQPRPDGLHALLSVVMGAITGFQRRRHHHHHHDHDHYFDEHQYQYNCEVYLAKQVMSATVGEVTKTAELVRAVKLLKVAVAGTVPDPTAKEEFVQECEAMLEIGDHPNVVRMVGVAVQQAPWLCVLEFLPHGDLRLVVLKMKYMEIEMRESEQLYIFLQIAKGCNHLALKNLIHMDLVARNVLVGRSSSCKIADFGPTRKCDPGTDGYVLKKVMKFAMKWAAPECIRNHQKTFSEHSDVWAVGIIYWEVLAYVLFNALCLLSI